MKNKSPQATRQQVCLLISLSKCDNSSTEETCFALWLNLRGGRKESPRRIIGGMERRSVKRATQKSEMKPSQKKGTYSSSPEGLRLKKRAQKLNSRRRPKQSRERRKTRGVRGERTAQRLQIWLLEWSSRCMSLQKRQRQKQTFLLCFDLSYWKANLWLREAEKLEQKGSFLVYRCL